ncbi:MAG: RHS repeat-associated core domain-containing protein [Bacteroidales bacterium]|nr:RHS repeat-associated core domain-containing protein [Bacteroidales bacterium]
MHPSSNALKLITVFIMLFACQVLYGMGSGNEKSVKQEDIHQGSLRALVKRGTNHTVALAAYKDYYPYGQLMPGRNYQTTGYRNGYQGQYAETDPETGFAHFEAREFDSRLGRWMVPDPARQHWSPYLGMGNNPVSGVDPDGRFFTKNETERREHVYTTNDGNPNTVIVPDNKLQAFIWGITHTDPNDMVPPAWNYGWHKFLICRDPEGINHVQAYKKACNLDELAGLILTKRK